MRKGNLQPAHKGYRYQDIATAYMLIRCLVDNFESVTVDKKQVSGDMIDDLEIEINGERIRRQFKSSTDPRRALSASDFKNPSSILPIDQLLLTYVRDKGNTISEFRLCATWSQPKNDDDIRKYIQLVEVPYTFQKSKTTCYKLNSCLLWPENSSPIWSVLDANHVEYNRDDFITFCEKFIIEIELPLASHDLAIPSDIEHEILELLAERVGIGRYPNQGRQPYDVAALAISLANLARTNEGTLTPSDIKANLEIQTDFGRIAQAFPFNEKDFYDRPKFRRNLKHQIINKSGIYLVTAEPGAGKSWELTRLANELKKESVIVARHYCYLEPGDELVERRVTTDVFFGNLLAELDDACKKTALVKTSSYSAGLSELEKILSKTSLINRTVILIIDGLDHIARVRSASSTLSDNETDIVEQISTLKYPSNVSIVIGSQPGKHLDPLRGRSEKDLSEHHLPKWTISELSGLAKKYNIHEALAKIMDAEQINNFLTSLSESADGNPLYARYISTSLTKGLEKGEITNPNDWLSSYPPINGNIANYYKFLYESASEQAQSIADLLGVLDFSVTQQELTNIAPSLVRSWIPRALSTLSPILTEASAQSGIRIFHESFRRFMIDELKQQGRCLQDVLEPIVAWLEQQGFYENAKSYRFLLPALRRANRLGDIFKYVNAHFISDSLAYVHSKDAIHKNLALTADIAGSMQNWSILVRCNELRRALHTYIEERDDNDDSIFEEYWQTSIILFGAEAIAERLLFDGRPILSRMKGLTICSMIDDAGGVAPWKEYFNLPHEKTTVSPFQALVFIHGRLRVGDYWGITRPIYKNLLLYDNKDFTFIKKLATRLSKMLSPDFVEKVASRISRNKKHTLPEQSITALRIGIAEFYRENKNHEQQRFFANMAATTAIDQNLMLQCLEMGAVISESKKFQCRPSEIDIGVKKKSYLEEGSTDAWLRAIRYTAIFGNSDKLLETERERIKGIGWYRCWLEYSIAIAEAEADDYRGKPYNIVKIFNILLRDTHPFTGEPRACDLYHAEGTIQKSFELGLRLLKTEAEWKVALSVLERVCNETSSRLDKEDGGPFRIGTFITILIPYAHHLICKHIIQEMIHRQVRLLDTIGSYYSTHAEYTMKLVRVQTIAGDKQAAFDSWKQAILFLTGYGFRKDITLFDIVESVPTLSNVSQKTALDALYRLQPLVRAVVRHTDGRSTKHIPNMWFDSLLKTHPIIAIELLSRTILEDHCIENWITLRALDSVLNTVLESANPMIVDALWQTLLIDIEHENEADKEIINRISPIKKLSIIHPNLAKNRLNRLAIEVSNDTKNHREDGVAAFRQAVRESSFAIPSNLIQSTARKKSKETIYKLDKAKSSFPIGITYPIFPQNPSILEILSSIREANKSLTIEDSKECITLPLSYLLCEMSDNNQEELAFRVLYFFIREPMYWWSSEPIFQLAQSLENAGYHKLAATTYALAFTHARGGSGWYALGDKKHRHMIDKALCIDRDLALETVSKDIGYKLRYIDYGAGISQSMIERLAEWGEPELAYQAWKEAFDVISLRLLLPPEHGWFAELDLHESPQWSIDEALVSLLLVRLSEPRLTRKMDAFEGLARVVRHYPEVVGKPLAWWLSRDTFISSILLILDLLLNAELQPYPITYAIEEQLHLYAQCSSWGMNKLARLLLGRANLDVPKKKLTSSLDESKIKDISLSNDKLRAILAGTLGNILDPFGQIWPELPRKIAQNIEVRFRDSEIHRNHLQKRYEIAYGRRHDEYPPTPTLQWNEELFISLLHDYLSELPNALWKQGLWSEEYENELFRYSLPDTRLHLAVAASRILRPCYPLPSELKSEVSSLMTIGDICPEHNDWVRLGIYEKEYVSDSEEFSGKVIKTVTVYSGAVAVPPGEVIPSRAFPFQPKDELAWWQKEYYPAIRLTRQIIGNSRVNDWFGDTFVLIPPTIIHNFFDLNIPQYAEPLIWKDQNSAPAIMMRTWQVRSTSGYSDHESVVLEGCDLIARPDVVSCLSKFSIGSLKELRIVDRQTVNSGVTE